MNAYLVRGVILPFLKSTHEIPQLHGPQRLAARVRSSRNLDREAWQPAELSLRVRFQERCGILDLFVFQELTHQFLPGVRFLFSELIAPRKEQPAFDLHE